MSQLIDESRHSTEACCCLNAKTGAPVWEAEVNGKACGLAVANGHLVVSTDRGGIYCFGRP